jgi:hypothetical protein
VNLFLRSLNQKCKTQEYSVSYVVLTPENMTSNHQVNNVEKQVIIIINNLAGIFGNVKQNFLVCDP